jgi:hypothetical protein
MSRTLRFVIAAVIAVGLVSTSIAVAATRDHNRRNDNPQTFTAHLIGYNETPSLNSTGVGDLTLTIFSDHITFDLTYSGLSGNPMAAHVHIGQVGVAGGVSFFFCGGGGKPACPAATSGEVSGTVVAADVVGPTAQGFPAGDFTDVVKAIEAGFSYANMHTAQFPAGEIRGQLVQGDGHGDDQD